MRRSALQWVCVLALAALPVSGCGDGTTAAGGTGGSGAAGGDGGAGGVAGTGGVGGAGGCDDELIECGGECVDLLTDERYCSSTGLCGAGCDLNDTCVEGQCVPPGPAMFDFSGAEQTFVVPNGVTSITVDVLGASAGDGWNVDSGGSVKGFGGLGGRLEVTLTTTPGETLYVFVGGAGADATTTGGVGGFNGGGSGGDSPFGYSGGGGGGASDIRRGGMTYDDRIAVAGGGGSGSGWCTNGSGNGGDGGGLIGADGELCTGNVGQGGTQSAGGSPDGAFGVGGTDPTAGAGAQAASAGGGGWYGGGSSNGSGAGGGSSYVTATGSDNVTHTVGFNDGDGRVIISW